MLGSKLQASMTRGVLADSAQIHHLEKREDLVGASGKAGYDGRYQSKTITNEVHSLCRRERCLSSTPRRTLRLV